MGRTVTQSFPITEFGNITVNTSILSSPRNYTSQSSRWVDYIVMHYTGNSKDTAAANANYFHNSNASASAHYFIDNSHCYQSVALKDRAWAVGGTSVYKHPYARNSNSISIEMCTSGNGIVSDTTIENAAQLCAELCRYIGITASQVDTYVIRHFDVWDKSCPAQWATTISSGFNAFKQRVKNILAGNGDELSMTQYEELKQIIERQEQTISQMQHTIDDLTDTTQAVAAQAYPEWNYIDKNLPEWATPTIQKLVDAGILKGNENNELELSNQLLRSFVILDRSNVFDNSILINTVKDAPEYAQETLKKLIDKKVINPESTNDLQLTLPMIRLLVYIDRLGLIA